MTASEALAFVKKSGIGLESARGPVPSLRQLEAIREIHTAEGKHKLQVVAFPKWVPAKVTATAKTLTAEQAGALLRSIM